MARHSLTGRRRRGSVFQLAAASYLSLAVGVATGPLLARALGPDGRGALGAVTAYAALLPLLLSLGLPQAVGRAAALAPADGRALGIVGARFALWATIPGALATAAIVAGPLASLDSASSSAAAVLLALSTPLGIFGMIVISILQAEGALRPLALLRALPLLLAAALTVLLFVTGTLTVVTALLSSLAGGIATCIANWRQLATGPTSAVRLRPLLKFGLRAYGAVVAGAANGRLGQLLMLPLAGAAALGVYSVALSIAILPVALSTALSARAYGAVAAAREPLDEATWRVRTTIALGVLSAGALALAAPILIPRLYGAEFASAVAPVLILLPGAVALAAAGTASSLLALLGRPGSVSTAESIALFAQMALLLLLLPRAGALGAAAAATASFSVSAVLQAFALRRLGATGLLPGRRDFMWIVRRSISGVMSRRALPVHDLERPR